MVIYPNQLEKLEAARGAWLVSLSLLSLIWPHLALLSFTKPYWASLSLTGPYLALLGLTGPYWNLLGLTVPYWALLGLTEPYWALLSLTGPYLALLGLILHLSNGLTHARTNERTLWLIGLLSQPKMDGKSIYWVAWSWIFNLKRKTVMNIELLAKSLTA